MRVLVTGAALILCLLPSPAIAWGFEAHKFIVARAIDLLPPELKPFFEAHRAAIVERAIDPDLWRATFEDEAPNHFLDLDSYGKYPFTELPRGYDDALKKYGPAKLKQEGRLPWRTHEMAGNLIRAFEGLRRNSPYSRGDIQLFASVIGHYVADGHVPLHAVRNYNGQLTGQTGIHSRWEDELFLRYREQLVINPGPLRSIRHERDFMFDVLLESAQLADEVLAADKKAIGGGDLYDDRYFATLWAETRPVLERRINDSINAVASMIASAWEQAGKPPLSAAPPPRTPQRRQGSSGTAPAIP